MASNRLVVATSLITVAWIALSATLFLYASSLREPTEEILFIRVHEDLDGTTTNFVQNTLNVAKYRGSRLIIVSLDTPGGYVDSTVKIMSLLDESEIPVVVFVEHEAVSGGTYFLMAAHVAVMSSGSQIGSCQPVDAYGYPITETKYINYLTGLMTRHAWLHSRNETAAELFITENLNLHAEEALNSGVINFIAESPRDLVSKLDGYTLIKFRDGEASRFTLVKSGEIGGYEVIESWDFENISETEIREYHRSIEVIDVPSFLSDWSILISIPLALLLPYIYTIFVVPLLSFTVTP